MPVDFSGYGGAPDTTQGYNNIIITVIMEERYLGNCLKQTLWQLCMSNLIIKNNKQICNLALYTN